MVIANVIGGLGNQMFQYAAGLALSHAHHTEFKLDLAYFKNYSLHNGFELEKVFNVTAEVGNIGDFYKMLGVSCIPIIRRILRRPAFAILRNSKHIVEPYQHFWAGYDHLPNNIYLDGYWQSEQYFKTVEPILRKEFSFKTEMNVLNQSVAEQINNSNSISLHVRRGDYVTNSKNAYIGTCSIKYYQEAIDRIKSLVGNPVFFVFSDDLDWAKSNLDINHKHIYIDFNKGADSFNDMRLMSLCKHHIIANSSFSWWGAWLNANPSKVVIAPKQWFANGQDDSDLIPDSWVRV